MRDNYDYYYEDHIYRNGKDISTKRKAGTAETICNLIGVLIMIACPPLGAWIIFTGAKHGKW